MPPEIETPDPVAEEAPAEEIVEVPAEETPAEEVTPDAAKRTEELLKDISKKLDKPAENKGPSQEEIRAAWRERVKKETSMTDQQIDYMENRMQSVVAPLYAEQTYNEWKQEKIAAGIDIDKEVEAGVKKYLESYDPRVRQDKTLLDNVLFMEIGKRAVAKKPAAAAAKPAATPVIGRTIVPQTPAPAQSLASGVRKPGTVAALTPEEKVMARKMRMTEIEYAEAKRSAVISDFKKK